MTQLNWLPVKLHEWLTASQQYQPLKAGLKHMVYRSKYIQDVQTELKEEAEKQSFKKTEDVFRFRQHLLQTSLSTQFHQQHWVLCTRLQQRYSSHSIDQHKDGKHWLIIDVISKNTSRLKIYMLWLITTVKVIRSFQRFIMSRFKAEIKRRWNYKIPWAPHKIFWATYIFGELLYIAVDIPSFERVI